VKTAWDSNVDGSIGGVRTPTDRYIGAKSSLELIHKVLIPKGTTIHVGPTSSYGGYYTGWGGG
jgi:hypothetical protein